MSQKTWGGRFEGGTDERVELFTESISFDHRLYTTPEYTALMREAGLEPEAFFGGFDGVALTWDTWRQIIVARRRSAL